MDEEPAARTAVLVVRMWWDAADESGFRARVLCTQDIEREPEVTTVTTDVAALLQIVRTWVEEFLRG
jgi:hypothetical protein